MAILSHTEGFNQRFPRQVSLSQYHRQISPTAQLPQNIKRGCRSKYAKMTKCGVGHANENQQCPTTLRHTWWFTRVTASPSYVNAEMSALNRTHNLKQSENWECKVDPIVQTNILLV